MLKNRKIQKNLENSGKIRKNSEKFGKNRKNSEKFGNIQVLLRKVFLKNFPVTSPCFLRGHIRLGGETASAPKVKNFLIDSVPGSYIHAGYL